MRLPRRTARATRARTDRARRYLRDTLKYGLGERERAGLRRFHELAAELASGSRAPALAFLRVTMDLTSPAGTDRNRAAASMQTRRAGLYREAPTHLARRAWPTSCARRKHPDGIVTYIIDRNVNYTNVCVARCNFCAFYRPVGHAEGYVLGFDEIFRKIDETIAVGGGQLLLQGGHNPDLPLAWYEDLFRAVKARYPEFKLHALSPPEVMHLSRMSQPAGRRGDRATRSPRVSTASPAAARRSSSTASASCSTATARPPRTSGSTSCVRRTSPACARRRP